jgi:hypothetical protein
MQHRLIEALREEIIRLRAELWRLERYKAAQKTALCLFGAGPNPLGQERFSFGRFRGQAVRARFLPRKEQNFSGLQHDPLLKVNGRPTHVEAREA